MAAPAAGPQVQSPPAAPCIHYGESQLAFKVNGAGEEGHKKGCWTEIKLYAAISKNLRFMKNIHLEGEIHQGVADGYQEPTVPTFLQNQHQQSKHQRCIGMQERHASLNCFTLDCEQDSPYPQGAAPLHGKQPALPPGTWSCQWQTNQPLLIDSGP